MQMDKDALEKAQRVFEKEMAKYHLILKSPPVRPLEAAITAYLDHVGGVVVPKSIIGDLDRAIKLFKVKGMEDWKQCKAVERCRFLITASQEGQNR